MNYRELIQALNEALLALENEEKSSKERLSQIQNELKEADEKGIEERTIEVSNLEKRLAEIASEKESKTKERDSLIEKEQSELDEAKKKETAQRKENKTMLTRRESQITLFGMALRNKPITEETIKERALDTSLTTTATTFVQATANADGVNNGGQLIPTLIVLDLLREDGALSPILADLIPTYIKGAVALPYRASRTKAQVKSEGSDVADAQWEWSRLNLVVGNLQTQLVVTDELNNMTDFDLGSYVLQTLEADFSEDWGGEVIYGTGLNGHISGITAGVTASTYSAGGELAVIETLIKGLTGKYRRRAKLYLSQTAYDGVAFSKDSHGDYVIPIVNNPEGIRFIANAPVEADENLVAGDIIFGDVGRFFKVNFMAPMHFETERSATKGTTTYVVNQQASAKAVPGAFKYAKLSA